MPPPSLAEMCREARSFLGLTQTEFAEFVGTNQTEISFIERGFIPMSQEKIKNITDLFCNIFPELVDIEKING